MSLSTYYLEYGRHVARLHRRRRRRAYALTRNTAGHDNLRKSIHGFPLFPSMGMGLRLFGHPRSIRVSFNINNIHEKITRF